MNFEVVLRDDKYWLEGHPEGPIGPYGTKAEANEGKAGLDRFYSKHIHEKPTYVPVVKESVPAGTDSPNNSKPVKSKRRKPNR